MFLKASLILFCFSYGISTSTGSENYKWVIPPKFFPDLVQVIGAYLDISLNHVFQNIPLSKPIVNLTDLGISNVSGTFDALRRNVLQGLNTLSLTKMPSISATNNGTGDYYTITLGKLELKKMGINFQNYIMDFGITKQLPLYGNGNILLGIQNVSLEIETSLNKLKVDPKSTSKWEMTDLKILVKFRHSKIFVTGIFNNRPLDPYLETVLTLLESVVAALWDYNADLISCVLGDVGKFVVNKDLFKHDPKLNITSDCLGSASPQLLNALYKAKKNVNMGEFLTLVDEKHLENFIAYFKSELTSALDVKN